MGGRFSSEGLESNLVGFESSVLSGDHNSESIKIGGIGSESESGHLLGSGLGSPFLIEFEGGGGLGKVTGSDTSQNSWNLQLGKLESSDWVNDSWERTTSIDLNSVNVNHINNDDHFAVVFTIIDVTNSTCFN